MTIEIIDDQERYSPKDVSTIARVSYEARSAVDAFRRANSDLEKRNKVDSALRALTDYRQIVPDNVKNEQKEWIDEEEMYRQVCSFTVRYDQGASGLLNALSSLPQSGKQ